MVSESMGWPAAFAIAALAFAFVGFAWAAAWSMRGTTSEVELPDTRHDLYVSSKTTTRKESPDAK